MNIEKTICSTRYMKEERQSYKRPEVIVIPVNLHGILCQSRPDPEGGKLPGFEGGGNWN